jgi:large subunit ribosomal protein L22
MQAIARAKHLRTSPNRMRQVADLVRGKSVDAAIAILFGLKKTKKSAGMVDKTLKAAIANFQNNTEAAKGKNLTIQSITVDGGPLMKRIRARAQGRAFRIEKKLSHLTIVISD